MTDKQYLEAVLLQLDYDTPHEEWVTVREETERRLTALKAQEDNLKSDMWEEER